MQHLNLKCFIFSLLLLVLKDEKTSIKFEPEPNLIEKKNSKHYSLPFLHNKIVIIPLFFNEKNPKM